MSSSGSPPPSSTFADRSQTSPRPVALLDWSDALLRVLRREVSRVRLWRDPASAIDDERPGVLELAGAWFAGVVELASVPAVRKAHQVTRALRPDPGATCRGHGPFRA